MTKSVSAMTVLALLLTSVPADAKPTSAPRPVITTKPGALAPDSELYVGGNLPPPNAVRSSNADDPLFAADASTQKHVNAQTRYWERDLARWKDPLTLPHSRAECVKWASGNWPWGGEWKTCIGWATQFQWYYNTATLAVDAPNAGDIEGSVNECLRDGAIAAAAAAIITGGAAAVAAFEETMKVCLLAKIGQVGAHVRIHGEWGDWE